MGRNSCPLHQKQRNPSGTSLFFICRIHRTHSPRFRILLHQIEIERIFPDVYFFIFRCKLLVTWRKIMKATGIVRRIDELGRVVIPKEIRRTLRIKEGDPLEIFTDRDELTLKKYSPIATLERFSEATARSLHTLSGKLAVIADTDEILYAYGDGKKDFKGKRISDDLDKILKERRSYLANAAEGGDVLPISIERETGVFAQVIVPIVMGGDCLGAVVLLSKTEGAKMDANDLNLAKLTADILSNQFE